MADLDRREFLAAAVSACALCALGGNVLAADSDKKRDLVDVGPLDSFKKDGIDATDVRSRGFFVIRNDGRLYAVTNKCTHKGVAINAKGDEFVCPKHNSHFSIEGTVTHGPAKNTLERYAISVDDKGHVIVDPNTSFHEKDFDDKASYVEVKK